MDTSTPAVTVALHDSERVVAESTTVDARRHTELLMPQVVDVLAEAGATRRDITRIAVGAGPGPFTGLRVGLAAARMMGAALGVPVAGVCGLDVIAAEVEGTREFAVATDARRREVYWAVYADGRRVRGPEVGPATDIVGSDGRPLPAAGAGPRLYPDAFAGSLDPEYPSAATMASVFVARAVERYDPRPLYLRRPDATPPAARKSVLTS